VNSTENSQDHCCQAPTTTTPGPQPMSCQLWGDPHIITFDGSQFVFYREGDFWIINSTAVKIQGRFQATSWTKAHDKTDYSSMTGIIIGGTVLNGHKIEVQPVQDNGKILCDGKPILKEFGSSTCSAANIYYTSKGALVDSAMSNLPHKVVHIELPGNVQIQVNRWPNFMNAKVTMLALPEGQDGVCGNFNGDPADDNGKKVHARFGAGVASDQLLFSKPIPLHIPKATASATKCPPEVKKEAEELCAQEMQGSANWGVEECIGDVCATTMVKQK